ncbi:MAG: hypothetical protein JJE22_03105 [Bacteroidia bacterium]|nr:hypothetical protein [Bacteroidia bacterium]
MLANLPAYITIVFILTCFLTLWFLWKASNSMTVVIVALIWLLIQGILSYSGFYLNSQGTPPRIALAVIPPLILIILILSTKPGTQFIRHLKLKRLHLLHIVRIPVEFCLYWLSVHKAVPELMTFAGNNFDIAVGITAPILYFTCFKRREVRSKNLLFAWNIIGLVFLGSIVVKAILSAPTIFQKLAFDQPNIAIFYFPFVWLPCFIVMAVLFSHLVMIKRLMTT